MTIEIRVMDGTFNGGAWGVMEIGEIANFRNGLPCSVIITESMSSCGAALVAADDIVIVGDLPRACQCGSGHDATSCPMNDQFCG